MFLLNINVWPDVVRGGLATQVPRAFVVLDDIARGKRPLLHTLFLKRGVNTLKAWFNMLDRTRSNKQGWPRQHFWKRVADSVRVTQTSTMQATIVVDEPGVGIKMSGGDITPKNSKWLTIPAVPEAYGKSAREFSGRLVFIKKDEQTAFLEEIKIGENIRIVYVLKKRVHIPKESGIMPDEGTWNRGMGDEFIDYLESASLGDYAPFGSSMLSQRGASRRQVGVF